MADEETTEESAAIVTIKRASEMTVEGRKRIADWLRQTADTLETNGDQLAGVFRARYLYQNWSKTDG